MLKLIKISIILLLLVNIFAIGALKVSAASLLNDPGEDMALNSKDDCMTAGKCELNDFTLIAINISKIILGIVGSLSLLAFVAGGLMWMLSAGNQEWVTRGKQTIIGAVIGLVVVFTSYTIIYFVYKSLGITEPLSKSSWFTADWFTEKYKNNR